MGRRETLALCGLESWVGEGSDKEREGTFGSGDREVVGKVLGL